MSFFIEYLEGNFVDGDKVNWIEIEEGRVNFTVDGDDSNLYSSDGKYCLAFINSMQAINHYSNLEKRYHEINKTGDDDEI